MINAPFLLQAFAARVLASKQEETVTRAELVRQGYDVETLVDMIDAYNARSEIERGFVVQATAEHIYIQRCANTAAPVIPSVGIPPSPHASTPDSRAPIPHSPDIVSLVNYSAKQRAAAEAAKKRPN